MALRALTWRELYAEFPTVHPAELDAIACIRHPQMQAAAVAQMRAKVRRGTIRIRDNAPLERQD